MRTFVIIAAMLVLLTGCTTQEKCLRMFPPQVHEVIKTEVITNTVVKDTTIYVTLPPEVVVNTDTVYVDAATGLINSKESYIATSLAWSTAQIVNSRLLHSLTQIDTTIEFRLQDAIRETERLEKELREKVTTIEVPRRLTWWQRTMIISGYLFWGGVLLVIGFIGLRLRL